MTDQATCAMLPCMRTVIASEDPNLTMALQFALRHEAGVDVLASVTTGTGLAALARSSTVDVFVIDASLAPAVGVIGACRAAGSQGVPAVIVVLASEGESVEHADEIVRKWRSPNELLDTLRRIRRERRHSCDS